MLPFSVEPNTVLHHTMSPNPPPTCRTDPNTQQILESMRAGSINIKQAAEALGMEPAMLAYQLAGKVGTINLHKSVSNNLSWLISLPGGGR